jgi:hypothetical protein
MNNTTIVRKDKKKKKSLVNENEVKINLYILDYFKKRKLQLEFSFLFNSKVAKNEEATIYE